MVDKKVVVRMAPSPTGPFHVGSVRTALYNWLFARQTGGEMVLRIEDTDKERSKKEFEENIYDSLKWLGLNWDNKEPIKQSKRTELYKAKIQELIAKGAAYISEESEGENKQVVRFKNPGGKIKFQDLIRGEVEMDVSDLNDFIIAKNVEEPLYHLAVVVDDLENGITHVIRGEDHISNTPRQVLILEALGGERPIYAHLPLVLATDKSKLSKRKHGESVSLNFYRSKSYEPEAILNFVALIGWNPGTEQEIFSLEELIKAFDLEKVQKKGGIFNIEKLDWINREHIVRQPKDSQISNLKLQINKTKYASHKKLNDTSFVDRLLKLMLDHIHRWGEVYELFEAGEYDYLFEKPQYEKDLLVWKDESEDSAKAALNQSLDEISGILDTVDAWGKIFALAEKEGRGKILWPLRAALSGKKKSPDPQTLLNLLGIEESRERIEEAIKKLA